ncbi:MAG TPA: SRPBCC family protein [Bdellovibrionota bacterium]|jgi:uncharacterized protein YndB with AHSA1/START domain|nr:SRPBCC family protein [Bdellovibrionota bacterium]
MTTQIKINPELDLVLERTTSVKPELLYRAWTEPKHLPHWFCPKPWRTTECEIDLRPGGKFYTVMEGPSGERHPGTGCYLEIIPNRKLVWTSALTTGYRPQARAENGADMLFTAVLMFEPHQDGTKYTAIAMHPDAKTCRAHAEMGFQEGWGAVFDQLVEYTKTMK